MGLLSADNRRNTAIAWGFVAVQFALLAVILLLPAGGRWTVPAWLTAGARVCESVGIVVLVVAMINLGRSLTPLPSPIAHGELRTGGMYRFVRHPIYSGIIALSVGTAIRSGNVATVVATAALIGWFMLKATEETQLLARYSGYRGYPERTPRFVPFWPSGHRTG